MKTKLIMPQARIGSSGEVDASPEFDPKLQAEISRIQGALSVSETFESPYTFVFFPNRRTVFIGTVLGKKIWVRSLARQLYERLPDPFFLSVIAPANWQSPSITDVSLDQIQAPHRDCKLLQMILKEGDSPFLLGGCQTLLDRGRILLQREQPDEKTIRDVWMLLPMSIQSKTSFCAFAPDNQLNFDLVVIPKVPETHPGFLSEDQARDYPESRYERELQIAIEQGEEWYLQSLLNRRSSGDTLRLAFMLVIGMAVLSIVGRILMR